MIVNRLKKLVFDTFAMAAVELALIAPVVFVLLIGLVELQSGLMQKQRAGRANHIAALLMSQSEEPGDRSIAGNIVELARIAMAPSPAELNMRLTFAAINDDGDVEVQWSHGDGMTALAPGTRLDLTELDLTAGDIDQFVMSESQTDLQLRLLGPVIPNISLEDRQVFLAREVRLPEAEDIMSSNATPDRLSGRVFCSAVPQRFRHLYRCGGDIDAACVHESPYTRWNFGCEPAPSWEEVCTSLPFDERVPAGC